MKIHCHVFILFEKDHLVWRRFVVGLETSRFWPNHLDVLLKLRLSLLVERGPRTFMLCSSAKLPTRMA